MLSVICQPGLLEVHKAYKYKDCRLYNETVTRISQAVPQSRHRSMSLSAIGVSRDVAECVVNSYRAHGLETRNNFRTSHLSIQKKHARDQERRCESEKTNFNM